MHPQFLWKWLMQGRFWYWISKQSKIDSFMRFLKHFRPVGIMWEYDGKQILLHSKYKPLGQLIEMTKSNSIDITVLQNLGICTKANPAWWHHLIVQFLDIYRFTGCYNVTAMQNLMPLMNNEHAISPYTTIFHK